MKIEGQSIFSKESHYKVLHLQKLRSREKSNRASVTSSQQSLSSNARQLAQQFPRTVTGSRNNECKRKAASVRRLKIVSINATAPHQR